MRQTRIVDHDASHGEPCAEVRAQCGRDLVGIAAQGDLATVLVITVVVCVRGRDMAQRRVPKGIFEFVDRGTEDEVGLRNNRAAFAPDGSLFLGQTDRGWGSTGGKSFGLQRLVWSGEVPFEIETMKLTADGFDVRFTRPVDRSAAATPANWSLSHYHYLYRAAYGSPQQEITPVKVTSATVSADGRTATTLITRYSGGLNGDGTQATLRKIGDDWLVVTTIVEDPQYLNGRFITSSHFRREKDRSKWNPKPCRPL